MVTFLGVPTSDLERNGDGDERHSLSAEHGHCWCFHTTSKIILEMGPLSWQGLPHVHGFICTDGQLPFVLISAADVLRIFMLACVTVTSGCFLCHTGGSSDVTTWAL